MLSGAWHDQAAEFSAGADASRRITSLSGVGGIIELVAGALIILGLFSRCAAFVASGEMAVAYFLVHMKLFGGINFFPTQNGGDAAILFCFIFLYLAAAGPGRFSVNGK